MQLARRLNAIGCLCDNGLWVPVPVRFVGLYDPVDMADPYPADGDAAGDRLSPNVRKWAVVTPEPFRNVVTGMPDALFSRQAWRRPNLAGLAVSHLTVEASHGGIGGAPGDWEPGVLPSWSMQQDTSGAQQADDFVRAALQNDLRGFVTFHHAPVLADDDHPLGHCGNNRPVAGFGFPQARL